MKIIKRNGSEAAFDISKIIVAIGKANATVDESIRMTPVQIQRIAESVVLSCEKLGRSPSVRPAATGMPATRTAVSGDTTEMGPTPSAA